jgi:hypothetical protein
MQSGLLAVLLQRQRHKVIELAQRRHTLLNATKLSEHRAAIKPLAGGREAP